MKNETKDPELHEVLDTLFDLPDTLASWNRFVKNIDPWFDCSEITGHGILAFFWLVTRDYRNTDEFKTKVRKVCATRTNSSVTDAADALGLLEHKMPDEQPLRDRMDPP